MYLFSLKIGTKHLKTIQTFLKENKEFRNFDQLLDLHGFGPRVLENICNVILNEDKVPEKTKTTISKTKTNFLTTFIDEAEKKVIIKVFLYVFRKSELLVVY